MKTTHSQELLAWEVKLPGTSNSGLGQRKPRGTVLFHTSEGMQSISVPASVARSLVSRQKAGRLFLPTEADLHHELRSSCHACAHLRVERLIDRREYASQELHDKLLQDGFDEDLVSTVLEESRAAGLVSDQRFGAAFIRSKLSSGWGTTRIARELSRRGISIDDVPGWPEQFQDEDDEEERALSIARRRVDGRPRCFERVVRQLCTKGYTLSVAMRATRSALDELDLEDEQPWVS